MSNTVLESVVEGEVALDVSRVQEELLSAVDGPLIDELVGRARQEGLELSGPNGLLAALTKRVLEAALEGEIYLTLGQRQPEVPMTGLDNPAKKEIAMQIVSSNENSSLNWRDQYKYIEDIHDERGYTGGILGFCSGTSDMLDLVKYFKSLEPGNILAQYIPALERVNGTDSHDGLDPNFVPDWQAAAADPLFQRAQDDERDRVYFNPAVSQGKSDGVGALGQFIYYDAFVMHGPGDDPTSFGGIRATVMEHADTPAQGGDEVTYLNAFLDARREVMGNEPDHVGNIDRIDTEQRVWVQQPNLNLDTPLSWTVNDQPFHINGNGGSGGNGNGNGGNGR